MAISKRIQATKNRLFPLGGNGHGQNSFENGPALLLKKAAGLEKEVIYELLNSNEKGLEEEQAEERSEIHGLNQISHEKAAAWYVQFIQAFINPFIGILIIIVKDLSLSLKRKGEEMISIPKSGRTHLMDAMPVTIGDEFLAYNSAITRAGKRIHERRNDLLEIAIGGTATGTGVNTPPLYRQKVIKNLRELTSLDLIPAINSHESLQSRSQMAAFSGALRELAIELIRIANDLRLMGSGPTAGLGEIILPPVQPGSSIMPGKVNPVMAECLNMVSYQIIGNDTTVSIAAQAGQLELNVMTPIMTSNILESLKLLNNYLPVFRSNSIEGIMVDEKNLRNIAGMNPSLVTLLSPKIGYLKAAEIAKEALEKKESIRDLVVERGILSVDEADQLFDLKIISKNRYADKK